MRRRRKRRGDGRRRGERARMGDYSVGKEEGGLEIPFEEVPFNWFKRVELRLGKPNVEIVDGVIAHEFSTYSSFALG